jgi:membrane protein YqaA with SNARE-associated domain
MEAVLQTLLDWFGMPTVGLPAVFIVATVSATLIPMGSEPVLFAYVSLNPQDYWLAITVATVGNTIGGMINWWLGLLARNTYESLKGETNSRAQAWLEQKGPPMLLLSWLPAIGDPLCLVAGWLRFNWLQCLIYMAIGKLLRYITLTWLLTEIPKEFWEGIGNLIGL